MTLAPTGQNLEKGLQGHKKKILGCFCAQITFPVERRGGENMLRDIYRPTFGQHIQLAASGGKLGKVR